MALNSPAAYAMYSQDVALNEVIHTLNQAGFKNEDICMILSPTHPLSALVRDASLFNSEQKSNDVTAALIGWLSEFGAVMIPTVGFFIRSQAFFHALMVAHDTPALCGNSRSLAGLGFSDEEADRFESQLRRFGVLVYVSCSEAEKTSWACEVLRHTGACEAATLEERITDPVPAITTGAVIAAAA
jgi:hypothetical protein